MTRRSEFQHTFSTTSLMRAIGAGAACVAMLAASSAAYGQEDPAPAEAVDFQSDREAAEEDLALIAEARGWTIEEARAQHEAAEAVEAVAEAVYEQSPETFVGTALSETPGGAPTLYLKGAADSRVGELAAQAAVPVRIVDHQPYSFAELQDLNRDLIDSLNALGYRKISSGTDIEAGMILAEVESEIGLASRSADVLSLLPDELAAGVRLRFTDHHDSGGDHAYGGARVRDDGVNECTSGWTVADGSGTTGVTTAGHCDGINEIVEPGVGVWALTHQNQHQGAWGDIEWKTSTHLEPPEFYASASTLRNTNSVESIVSISIGESVCLYGRTSNSRDCSSVIASTSWSCSIAGFDVGSMARTNQDIGVGGDSGGGWSYSTTAYGGHVGWCPHNGSTFDVFTIADLFDEALGVQVRTN